MSLVDRAAASDPYGTRLERPIERYSGDELERWALRRLSVQRGWISDQRDTIYPREICFKTSMTKPISVRCLITGGRWLLAVLHGGIVMAADLENPNASQQTLIQPQDEFDKSVTLALLFSTVDGEPTLTFDLVLLHGAPFGELHRLYNASYILKATFVGPRDCAERLSVWRIVLSDDGTNLSACQINSFWTKNFPNFAPQSFAFSGNYFARVIIDDTPRVSSLEIIDWRLSTSDLHLKATFCLQLQWPVRSFICFKCA